MKFIKKEKKIDVEKFLQRVQTKQKQKRSTNEIDQAFNESSLNSSQIIYLIYIFTKGFSSIDGTIHINCDKSTITQN